MGIGKVIKTKRIEAGLTQKDLAKNLNITFQAVSRWEKDEAEPSVETIKKLAKLFKCTIEELFFFDDEG